MPTIEITEEQAAYIEDLRSDLKAHHVGPYGTVRTRDAVQFLIDHRESGVTLDGGDSETTSDTSDSGAKQGETTADEEASGDGGDGGPGRLNAMMQLLDTHEDTWEEVDSDQGKYAVTLPDGETEHVRTKDDVRALLFQHYD